MRLRRSRFATEAVSLGEAGAAVGLHAELLDRQRREAKRLAVGGGDLFKVEDALGVGQLVDAVDGFALCFQPMRDALVGGEHELFDEPVRPAAFGAGNGGHVALRVELDDRLGQVEIDGAATVALAVEQQRELVHLLDGRDE